MMSKMSEEKKETPVDTANTSAKPSSSSSKNANIATGESYVAELSHLVSGHKIYVLEIRDMNFYDKAVTMEARCACDMCADKENVKYVGVTCVKDMTEIDGDRVNYRTGYSIFRQVTEKTPNKQDRSKVQAFLAQTLGRLLLGVSKLLYANGDQRYVLDIIWGMTEVDARDARKADIAALTCTVVDKTVP